MHLTLGQHRIEDTTAVIYRDVAPQGHAAGLAVDLDDGDVTAEWKDEARRLEIPRRLQPRLEILWPALLVRGFGDLREGNAATGHPAHLPVAIINEDVGRCRLE